MHYHKYAFCTCISNWKTLFLVKKWYHYTTVCDIVIWNLRIPWMLVWLHISSQWTKFEYHFAAILKMFLSSLYNGKHWYALPFKSHFFTFQPRANIPFYNYWTVVTDTFLKRANEDLNCCNINQSCCIFCNIFNSYFAFPVDRVIGVSKLFVFAFKYKLFLCYSIHTYYFLSYDVFV